MERMLNDLVIDLRCIGYFILAVMRNYKTYVNVSLRKMSSGVHIQVAF